METLQVVFKANGPGRASATIPGTAFARPHGRGADAASPTRRIATEPGPPMKTALSTFLAMALAFGSPALAAPGALEGIRLDSRVHLACTETGRALGEQADAAQFDLKGLITVAGAAKLDRSVLERLERDLARLYFDSADRRFGKAGVRLARATWQPVLDTRSLRAASDTGYSVCVEYLGVTGIDPANLMPPGGREPAGTTTAGLPD